MTTVYPPSVAKVHTWSWLVTCFDRIDLDHIQSEKFTVLKLILRNVQTITEKVVVCTGQPAENQIEIKRNGVHDEPMRKNREKICCILKGCTSSQVFSIPLACCAGGTCWKLILYVPTRMIMGEPWNYQENEGDINQAQCGWAQTVLRGSLIKVKIHVWKHWLPYRFYTSLRKLSY